MLQVFFLIVKIIGIILAAVLGLAFLLLLLVLFVPVRYSAFGVKNGQECRAEAKISWLLHLISVPVCFRDGELQGSIRIFGFPVMTLFGDEEPRKTGRKKRRKKKKESRQEREDFSGGAEEWTSPAEAESTEARDEAKDPEDAESAEARDEAKDPEDAESTETQEERTGPENTESADAQNGTETVPESTEEEETTGIWKTLGGFLRLLWNFFCKIRLGLKNLKCTFRRFCDKIKRMIRKYRKMKAFAEDERTKAAVRLVWSQTGVLARHALPRRLKGEVHFGTEDPALTGQILGVLGIFYPLFMDNVKVNPDFGQAVLEGELSVKGRLRAAVFVRTAWKLYRDKNVRYVYRRLNRS